MVKPRHIDTLRRANIIFYFLQIIIFSSFSLVPEYTNCHYVNTSCNISESKEMYRNIAGMAESLCKMICNCSYPVLHKKEFVQHFYSDFILIPLSKIFTPPFTPKSKVVTG